MLNSSSQHSMTATSELAAESDQASSSLLTAFKLSLLLASSVTKAPR